MEKKILVIMTGGTICSAPNKNDKRDTDSSLARSYIIDGFRASSSPYAERAEFEICELYPNDVLSENMTVDVWMRLIGIFRSINFEDYSGIVMLHGTDTLAYTSAMLSVVLAGITVPVMMVSAQLPLVKKCDGVTVPEERTNGYANFRCAVELIMNGIAPNVYAVYRNIADKDHTPGEMLVHYGAHLEQCRNYSNNFYSCDAMTAADADNAVLKGKAFETSPRLFERIFELSGNVLYLVPYVGLDYSRIAVDGLDAVVHGTYHSDTVCVERKSDSYGYSKYSILCLLDRCRDKGVPLYLAPCDSEAYAYASTGDALRNGAKCIPALTNEMAYVKTLVGCSLGYRCDELDRFICTDINYESVK